MCCWDGGGYCDTWAVLDGVTITCVCVFECLWMLCLLTGECVFYGLLVFVPLGVGVYACVCLRGQSVVFCPRACVRVSGGQGDKGACFFLIRTPTSTSLSLYCSTSLLSIPLPFPLHR